MITIPDPYIIRKTKPNITVAHRVLLSQPGQGRTFLVGHASKPKMTPWVGRTFSLPEPGTTLEIILATHIPDTNCFLEDL